MFMKRTLTLTFAFVWALAGGLAQPLSTFAQAAATAAPGTPALTLATNTYDFGRIKQGEAAKHTFYFTNTGSATLEIRDVKAGCGCTTMGTWDKTVAPGQVGSIPLQFNSAGFSGKIHKSATVICNVPGQTNVLLHIQGEVWRPVEVTPQMVTFTFPADDQTNQTRTVKIVNNLEEEITLNPPECVNASFKPELKVVRPGREWELAVTAVAPMAPPTQLATVLIRTSSTKVPAINVTAYASIPPLIAASPNQITLPPGPLKNPFTAKVNVRNNTASSVVLSDLAINAPGAEAKLEISRDGKYFTVNVSFPAEFQVAPGQAYELTLKTDHPKVPSLRVPVFQPQPPRPVTTSMQPVTAPAGAVTAAPAGAASSVPAGPAVSPAPRAAAVRPAAPAPPVPPALPR